MECTEVDRGLSSHRELFHGLTEVYGGFLRGSCPEQRAQDVASWILRGVCGRVPGESSWELISVSVTLVKKLICGVELEKLPPDALVGWREILRLLFQDMDLMSQLVLQLQNKDQLIAHLAANTVSVCVFYRLSKSGTVSPVWQKKCVETFSCPPPADDLDSCLWSLSQVFKKLLKEASQVLLKQLVAAFNSSLVALCSKLLPEEKTGTLMTDVSFNGSWGATFCLLLDLLEVLTASSFICEAGTCLECQRIPQSRSSALLTAVSCCSQDFVKRRILLLLKKVLLQKVGDDWSLGGAVEHKNFSSDVSLLAESVLKAVAGDWLQRVHVAGAAVFFGGAQHVRGGEGPQPDGVMLRAVSLVLLKSMELHFQTLGAAAGVDRPAEVCGYLHRLWGFLRRCSLMEVPHLCCWTNLLFGDQDDDLMEAARSFLSIFLLHRPSPVLEDSVSEEACSSGFSPHCHFVLLLQSFTFDHSVLLDFLISTETCFLEYFVSYLKYLQGDWRGFTAACHRVWCGGGPSLRGPPSAGFRSGAGLRLVDYDSSDESSTEESETVRPGCEETTPCNLKPVEMEQDPNGLNSPSSVLSHTESRLEPGAPVPPDPECVCDTLSRAVLCLSELRQVLTRLQTKQLFPYNPTSLLKLLAQVESGPPSLRTTAEHRTSRIQNFVLQRSQTSS